MFIKQFEVVFKNHSPIIKHGLIVKQLTFYDFYVVKLFTVYPVYIVLNHVC